MKHHTRIQNSKTEQIPGYDYGRSDRAPSPLSLAELRRLEQCVGWSDEDAGVLRRHADIFKTYAEPMVSSWREVIAAQPDLLQSFLGPDGKRDEEYAARVKRRFVRWVIDVVERPHDQAWLDYQEEIGLRHTPEKKNRTDNGHTPAVVPLRYLLGFVPVVALGARSFFVEAGVSGQELHELEQAWLKAVQLHVTLWSRPYVKEGLW